MFIDLTVNFHPVSSTMINSSLFDEILCILRFDLKETTFAFGHFTTIYGHFFANSIDIFHYLRC